MDDQALISRAVPAGWQVAPYGVPGLYVLSPGGHQGFVTIDMKRRLFALGMCQPRGNPDPAFAGRNWKVALINAAITAHQAVMA